MQTFVSRTLFIFTLNLLLSCSLIAGKQATSHRSQSAASGKQAKTHANDHQKQPVRAPAKNDCTLNLQVESSGLLPELSVLFKKLKVATEALCQHELNSLKDKNSLELLFKKPQNTHETHDPKKIAEIVDLIDSLNDTLDQLKEMKDVNIQKYVSAVQPILTSLEHIYKKDDAQVLLRGSDQIIHFLKEIKIILHRFIEKVEDEFSVVDALLVKILKKERSIVSAIDVIESDLQTCCFTLNSKLDVLITDELCDHTPIIIPSSGTTISLPGVYCLAASVKLNPGATGISIEASNVVLDLNDYTIAEGAIAIQVPTLPGPVFLRTITIKNGFTRDQSATGIDLQSPSNIIIENIELVNTPTAINATNVINASIKNVLINSSSSHFPNVNGIVVSGGLDLAIENCQINGDFFSTSGTGFNFHDVTDSKLINCICHLYDTGFELDRCAGIAFDSCYSTSNFINGFECFNSIAIKFVNCEGADSLQAFNIHSCNDIVLDLCFASFVEIGFKCFDSASMKFTNCQSMQNFFRGFEIDNSREIVLDSCLACETEDAGFECSGSADIQFLNCQALNSSGSGYYLKFVSSGNISLLNCLASNNQGGFKIFGSDTRLPGFDTNSFYLYNCVATNNFCDGFDISAPNGLLEKCVSMNNGVLGAGTACISSNLTNGVGFIIHSDRFGAANNCILKNCSADNNFDNGYTLTLVRGCLISECQSSNNDIGYDLSGVLGSCTVEKSIAKSNRGEGFLGTGDIKSIFYLNNGNFNGTDFMGIGVSSAPVRDLSSPCRLYGDNLSLSGGSASNCDIVTIESKLDVLTKFEEGCCFTVNSKLDHILSSTTI